MNLLCLACSHRPGGRCIAGIDLDTGRWVRPVPRLEDAIPEARCRVRGEPLAPLDLLRIPTARLGAIPRYQRENALIQNWSWAVTGKLAPAELDRFVDDAAPILHGPGDRVSPDLLEKLPPEEWRSLQLVRPRNLTFEPDRWNRDPWAPNRYRARFQDAGGHEYVLIATDPLASRRLDRREPFRDDVLLTVSLTRPYASAPGQPAQCYKIVAAVIER